MQSKGRLISSDDREYEFLRACLASKLFRQFTLPDPPRELDWDRLYGLLKVHRLAEHFYVLGKSQRDQWPDSFRNHLRLDRYGLMIYGDQCLGRIRTLLSALTEAGISVIVLKGWALIQSIYEGDFSQRFCEDMDILIHPKDVDVAENILQSLGYQGQKEIRTGYIRRYRNARAYFDPGQIGTVANYFSVGLHWGLFYIPAYDPRQIDVNDLFARAHNLEIADVPVHELSPEDHIVYSCAHLALHHYSDKALFRYYELGSVVASEGSPFDWDRVIESARLWHEIIPVRNILDKTDCIFKGIIPANVLKTLSKLRPIRREIWVNAWINKTGNRPVYEHFLMWLALPAGKKFFAMLEDIFPGPDYMQRGYGYAPGGVWPLLYFRRFARVFGYLLKKDVV